MAVPMPNQFEELGESGMIAYANTYRGRVYLNIRKTYRDRDTDERAVGKGLTVSVSDFRTIVEELPAIAESLYEQADSLARDASGFDPRDEDPRY